MKLIYYGINVLVYFSVFITVFAQINEPCTVQYSGNPGVCKLDKDCQIAMQQIAFGIRPTYCGFIKKQVIVCCEGYTGNPEPNDFSLLIDDEDSTPKIPEPPPPAVINNPAFSKSQQYCEEYKKHVESPVTGIILLPFPEQVTYDIAKCDYSSVPLIVGGENATAGEFPHMAALGYKDGNTISYICGGTLISDQYVLTAAHCIKHRNKPETVRLGDLNLKRTDDVPLPPIEVDIEELIPHPQYKPPAKYNDIALVKLKRRVEFNKFVRPACLWNSPNFDRAKAVATGWGLTAFNSQEQSDHLLKVVLGIFTNKKCSSYEKYQPSRKSLPQGIVPSMVCAGDLNEAKDTCQGDSGGPLVVTDKKNPCLFHVIGVTSFGVSCAQKIPAVYSRVSSYISWIESIVWT